MLIATHQSSSACKSKWWAAIFIPFARCQSKSLVEQLEKGCTYFDLRLRYDSENKLIFAHGPWESSSNVYEEIHNLDKNCNSTIYTRVLYEGTISEDKKEFFINDIENLIHNTEHIKLTYIAAKGGGLRKNYIDVPLKEDFLVLDKSSWHSYIPIPWMWKKLYHNKTEFNNDYYKQVDFL